MGPQSATIEAGTREQTRARYPDETGLRGTRRRPRVLGAVRRRRSDGAAAADLVDHPLAVLEGADPVPRAPLPRAHVRRPRQRPLGSAGGSRALRHRRVRGRRDRGDGCEPGRARDAGVDVVRRAVGNSDCRRPPRARGPGCVHRPGRGARTSASRTRRVSVRRGTPTQTRAGRSTTRHYWARDYLDFLEFFFPQVLQRAALDQTDRGWHRLGARDDARGARGRHARNRVSAVRSHSSSGLPSGCNAQRS